MDAADKAAVLLLSLEKPIAAEVLSLLPKNQVEEITFRLAKMEDISKNEQKQVFNEFYDIARESVQMERGGMDFADDLLKQSLGQSQAQEILDNIKQSLNSVPFGFMHKMEAENLVTYLSEEHPQTIALVISHLPTNLSAEIVSRLNPEKQMEVIRRIANMEQTSPEVIEDVEKTLEKRMTSMLSRHTEKAGGVEMVAKILNTADRSTHKTVFEQLEQDDIDLAEEIKRLMFVFDDLVKLDTRSIQTLFKEVSNSQWSMALKGASAELTEKVMGNLSQRAAELLKEEMEFLGPVKLSEVEAMQQEIVDIIRRLEDSGEIDLSNDGTEEMVT